MPNYVDQINLNGNIGDIKGCGDDRYYPGVDLTTQFAVEIMAFSSPWEWLKSRIQSGNFSQIHVFDYIPVTCTNGVKFNARIAGINTYKGYGDTAVPDHIDLISDTLWPIAVKMNKANFNNGLDGDHQFPWLSSNGYYYLNSLAGNVPNETGNMPATTAVDYTSGGIYSFLPEDLQDVIVTKRLYLPRRQSTSGIQSTDNGGDWTNAGKLWLPTEVEITGAPIHGDKAFGAMGSVQYPIFAGNMARRIEGYSWPTLNAAAGNSTDFVAISEYGLVSTAAASTDVYAPVCFRVA